MVELSGFSPTLDMGESQLSYICKSNTYFVVMSVRVGGSQAHVGHVRPMCAS
ncbi:hypothetical protein GIB67_038089 [Kingdonia uniflora]|uniref:Uncharacterized protein n=1 Tax=Kingdonia uniflora TaxID=39325 RepID=A0A7J7P7U5_9MAGN|nr:hypothetical protein GIB67_038089 [Kingdonia uniflora]